MLNRLAAALLAALVLVGCGPGDPPPASSALRVPFTVVDASGQPIPQLVCTLTVDNQPPVPCTYTGDDAVFTLDPAVLGHGAQLELSAPGYRPLRERLEHVTTVRTGKTLQRATLPRLVTDGVGFRLETGEAIFLLGINDHQLFERWLHDRPRFDRVLAQRQALGFNKLRVFSMCFRKAAAGEDGDRNGMVPCDLAYDAAYYAAWAPFAQQLAAAGFYLQVDVFACARGLMPDAGAQQRHWAAMGDALRSSPNVILTLGNELNNACNQIDPALFRRPDGLLVGKGSNNGSNIPPRPAWDFESAHWNGASEWQRKTSHNSMEYHQGAGDEIIGGVLVPGVKASRVPVISDENPRPDQDRNLEHHFDAAKSAKLLIGGYDYHCDQCRYSEVLEGLDLDGAQVTVAGAAEMPLWCQRAGDYSHPVQLERPIDLRTYLRGTDLACLAPVRR